MIKQGQLDVIGTGEVKINLGTRRPIRVTVDVEEGSAPSCNPHQDRVFWEIMEEKHYHRHEFLLLLRWDVSDLQTIKYFAE